MTDIVERLRYWAFKFCGKGEREDIASDAMTDGWQEIERLREALRPFADIAKLYVNDTDREVTDNIDKWEFCVPFPNLRKAYEALGEKE